MWGFTRKLKVIGIYQNDSIGVASKVVFLVVTIALFQKKNIKTICKFSFLLVLLFFGVKSLFVVFNLYILLFKKKNTGFIVYGFDNRFSVNNMALL